MTQTIRPLAREARFADLSVVALPTSQNGSARDYLILEAMLFDAGSPTLIIPQSKKSGMPDKIVIGWDESPQALRAIRSALPFLIAATEVHIAIIDPPDHGPDRSDPGGALAIMLARHGINCDIQVMSSSGSRVSERLRRHVTETDSDMLVMGGYGHSRFREALLGGATREMLEHATVPVLMAH